MDTQYAQPTWMFQQQPRFYRQQGNTQRDETTHRACMAHYGLVIRSFVHNHWIGSILDGSPQLRNTLAVIRRSCRTREHGRRHKVDQKEHASPTHWHRAVYAGHIAEALVSFISRPYCSHSAVPYVIVRVLRLVVRVVVLDRALKAKVVVLGVRRKRIRDQGKVDTK